MVNSGVVSNLSKDEWIALSMVWNYLKSKDEKAFVDELDRGKGYVTLVRKQDMMFINEVVEKFGSDVLPYCHNEGSTYSKVCIDYYLSISTNRVFLANPIVEMLSFSFRAYGKQCFKELVLCELLEYDFDVVSKFPNYGDKILLLSSCSHIFIGNNTLYSGDVISGTTFYNDYATSCLRDYQEGIDIPDSVIPYAVELASGMNGIAHVDCLSDTVCVLSEIVSGCHKWVVDECINNSAIGELLKVVESHGFNINSVLILDNNPTNCRVCGKCLVLL